MPYGVGYAFAPGQGGDVAVGGADDIFDFFDGVGGAGHHSGGRTVKHGDVVVVVADGQHFLVRHPKQASQFG